MSDRVRVIDQIDWPFRDQGGGPDVSIRVGSGYPSRIQVDPFPGYGHDPDLVSATLAKVEAAFPLPEPFAPTFFILTNEVASRTNGQQGYEHDYDWQPPEDDPADKAHQRPWRGYVVLSGKRIPPHPALTRYLVAHEYGHVVEDYLKRGRREPTHGEDLVLEYADRRGLSPTAFVTHGAGGSWHRSITEIFACDFRVLIAKVELEYWPHPGVDRPEGLRKVRRWWRQQARKWAHRSLESAA